MQQKMKKQVANIINFLVKLMKLMNIRRKHEIINGGNKNVNKRVYKNARSIYNS